MLSSPALPALTEGRPPRCARSENTESLPGARGVLGEQDIVSAAKSPVSMGRHRRACLEQLQFVSEEILS